MNNHELLRNQSVQSPEKGVPLIGNPQHILDRMDVPNSPVLPNDFTDQAVNQVNAASQNSLIQEVAVVTRESADTTLPSNVRLGTINGLVVHNYGFS